MPADDLLTALLAELAECDDDDPATITVGQLRTIARLLSAAGTAMRRASAAERRAAVQFREAAEFYRRASSESA